MSVELKPPVSRYFEATNSHRADAVAALFSNEGLVHDEGTDHRGCGAIRDWAESTYRRYDVRVSPTDAREDGNATVVRTRVAGSFVGSPLMLSFRFVTSDDLIDELVVGFREAEPDPKRGSSL